MAAKRSSNSRNRKTARRLLFHTAADEDVPATVPTRWLKNVIGLFLVPVAWVLTEALFTSFAGAARDHAFWATEEFWFFTLGALVWTLAFCGSLWARGTPSLLRAYVLGHELTHAIWAFVMGGKIFAFKATRAGGHIETDTHNFWVALTPYFHPLYSILVIELYAMTSLFYDVSAFYPLLFGLLGLTWAFHLSFTLWMIPKGQSDLAMNGYFFSLVLIYVMNLLTLSALLIFAAPEVTFVSFWSEVERHAIAVSDAVLALVEAAIRSFSARRG